MEVRVHLKYARISPREVSIVLDLIRGKGTSLVMVILEYTPETVCEDLQKLLRSAIVDAENNYNMDVTGLYVAEYFVSPGPILKRIHPRAQGRTFRILKRTSRVTLVLKEKEQRRG